MVEKDRGIFARDKVKSCEKELFELEDDYQALKDELEKEWNLYQQRLKEFKMMTDRKIEEANATFRRQEITDTTKFYQIVETVSYEVELTFQQQFSVLEEKRRELDELYQKTYHQMDDRLTEAYHNFLAIDSGLTEKRKESE